MKARSDSDRELSNWGKVILLYPNEQAHRRRAKDDPIEPTAQSRRSVR